MIHQYLFIHRKETKMSEKITIDYALMITLNFLTTKIKEHNAYLRLFPEGKDFVFDVMERIYSLNTKWETPVSDYDTEFTEEEYKVRLQNFLPEIEKEIVRRHTIQ